MDSTGEIPIYKLIYKPGWDENYLKMDKSVQEMIMKKIDKQQYETHARHMKKGTEFSVLEIGQYRVALIINEKEKTKEINFAGNHKQYENWFTKVIGFHDEEANGGNYTKYLEFISAFSKRITPSYE